MKNQKDYYSEKKRHTIKVQLFICLTTLLIIKANCVRGSVHDFKLFKESKLKLAKTIIILTDLGYLGIKQFYHKAMIPFKASKSNPLIVEEKRYNRKLSQKRIPVENKIRECKIFRMSLFKVLLKIRVKLLI